VIGVVLPAGGLGRRMGGDRPKQLLEIGGVPVWLHTMRAFAFRSDCAAISLVVPADWLDYFQKEVDLFRRDVRCNPQIIVVAGGAERWLSVRNGITALPSEVDRVMVHDVARPFVSHQILDRCVEEISAGRGVIVACPASDTVKRVSSEGRILETIDRREIWLAQTPQCFLRCDLEKWMELAEKESDFTPTDEASLAEHYGSAVSVIRGDSLNDKMTLPEDRDRFEALWNSGYFNRFSSEVKK
jgi:2-C-methyl-D-erythritol 4-phosphate cytidylyltransferase